MRAAFFTLSFALSLVACGPARSSGGGSRSASRADLPSRPVDALPPNCLAAARVRSPLQWLRVSGDLKGSDAEIVTKLLDKVDDAAARATLHDMFRALDLERGAAFVVCPGPSESKGVAVAIAVEDDALLRKTVEKSGFKRAGRVESLRADGFGGDGYRFALGKGAVVFADSEETLEARGPAVQALLRAGDGSSAAHDVTMLIDPRSVVEAKLTPGRSKIASPEASYEAEVVKLFGPTELTLDLRGDVVHLEGAVELPDDVRDALADGRSGNVDGVLAVPREHTVVFARGGSYGKKLVDLLARAFAKGTRWPTKKAKRFLDGFGELFATVDDPMVLAVRGEAAEGWKSM
ncbi:MAG: hypothetical protein ACHREM_25590, partial [Polyangiales bacterium]